MTERAAWGINASDQKPIYFQKSSSACKITSLNYSHDGTMLLIGDNKGDLCLWDLEAGKRKWPEGQWVESVCFSNYGNFIVSGFIDGNSKIWNTADNVCIAKWNINLPNYKKVDIIRQNNQWTNSYGIIF